MILNVGIGDCLNLIQIWYILGTIWVSFGEGEGELLLKDLRLARRLYGITHTAVEDGSDFW